MPQKLRWILTAVLATLLSVGAVACSSEDDAQDDQVQPSESLADMFDPDRQLPSNDDTSTSEVETPSVGELDDSAEFADVPDTPFCRAVIEFKKNNSFINEMTAELVALSRRDRGSIEATFTNTKPELLQAAQSAVASVQTMKELVPSDVAGALTSQQVLVQNALDSLLDADSFADFANDTSNFARPMLADLIEAGFIYNPYIKDECQITLT